MTTIASAKGRRKATASEPPLAESAAVVRRRSVAPFLLSAEILRTLAGEVLTGQIPPGAKLEEEALCQRFSASRTPVREALRQLAAQGVVEIRPRQGAFVVQLTVESLVEMFECMGHLEAACASLAARRHTAEDRLALSSSHEACIQAAQLADPIAFYGANAQFHQCIYRASHNNYLARQTLELCNRLEAYRRDSTFHPGLMSLSIREHQEVLDAIFAMDEVTSAMRMRQHLDTLRNDAVSMAVLLSKRLKAA